MSGGAMIVNLIGYAGLAALPAVAGAEYDGQTAVVLVAAGAWWAIMCQAIDEWDADPDD